MYPNISKTETKGASLLNAGIHWGLDDFNINILTEALNCRAVHVNSCIIASLQPLSVLPLVLLRLHCVFFVNKISSLTNKVSLFCISWQQKDTWSWIIKRFFRISHEIGSLFLPFRCQNVTFFLFSFFFFFSKTMLHIITFLLGQFFLALLNLYKWNHLALGLGFQLSHSGEIVFEI